MRLPTLLHCEDTLNARVFGNREYLETQGISQHSLRSILYAAALPSRQEKSPHTKLSELWIVPEFDGSPEAFGLHAPRFAGLSYSITGIGVVALAVSEIARWQFPTTIALSMSAKARILAAHEGKHIDQYATEVVAEKRDIALEHLRLVRQMSSQKVTLSNEYWNCPEEWGARWWEAQMLGFETDKGGFYDYTDELEPIVFEARKGNIVTRILEDPVLHKVYAEPLLSAIYAPLQLAA